MFPRLTVPVALALAVAALGGSPASAVTSPAPALTWTPPIQLPGRYIDLDAGEAPPLAVNRRGDVAASWIGPNGHVVAVGNRTHGFSKPTGLPALTGLPTVAIGPNGTAIAGWTADDSHAWYATLSASGARGAPHRIDAQAVATEGTVFAAQPDGSYLVAYHATDRHGAGHATLRALRIGPTGHAGPPTIVSASPRFGADYELDGASTPGGELFVCCGRTAGGRTLGWRYSPGKGWSSSSFRVGPHEYRGALAAAPGLTLSTNTDARKGAFGIPVLELLRPGNVRRVAIDVPHPTATTVKAGTIDARGRPLVTFADGGQLYGVSLNAQDAPGSPSPLGPVPSDPADAPGLAQPVAGPWRSGGLVAWVDKDHWRVATEQDGVFTTAPAPPGVVDSTGLATAGGAAALSWYDHNHHAFVSIAGP